MVCHPPVQELLAGVREGVTAAGSDAPQLKAELRSQ
jgi:hypothetical protein